MRQSVILVVIILIQSINFCQCQNNITSQTMKRVDYLIISDDDRGFTEVINEFVHNTMACVAKCYREIHRCLSVVYDEKNTNCSIVLATSTIVCNKADGSFLGGNIYVSVDYEKIMYSVKPKGSKWKLIQRNINPNGTSFDQDWSTYKTGFGSSPDYCNDNFWIGLTKMHDMTKDSPRRLKIEMIRNGNPTVYVAHYDQFQVGPESTNFTLSISGFNSSVSTAGNSITNIAYGSNNNLNGMMFSTKDRDNDHYGAGSCSHKRFNIGWWFKSCTYANLNGKLRGFFGNDGNDYKYVHWLSLTHSVTDLASIKISVWIPEN